ncbi:substrate-binding domain-containing protein [Moorena sp. SIO2C4]|uniref:substrate-binding domain-containing protein n=1 Tax=Moorena sp. SIO2C4 TaxID=2607824 RepID=UPI00257D6B06|nr:substrate-binding domain-containing protein [Moorena sp. SIO2C4]
MISRRQLAGLSQGKRKEVDQPIQRMQPKLKLKYEENETELPGSVTGIKMLLNGQLYLAQSSRYITDKESYQARQNGFSIRAIPVAINGIAIAVNPNLKVSIQQSDDR